MLAQILHCQQCLRSVWKGVRSRWKTLVQLRTLGNQATAGALLRSCRSLNVGDQRFHQLLPWLSVNGRGWGWSIQMSTRIVRGGDKSSTVDYTLQNIIDIGPGARCGQRRVRCEEFRHALQERERKLADNEAPYSQQLASRTEGCVRARVGEGKERKD